MAAAHRENATEVEPGLPLQKQDVPAAQAAPGAATPLCFRVFGDSGERILADLEQVDPKQPEQFATRQRHHERTQHDLLTQ